MEKNKMNMKMKKYIKAKVLTDKMNKSRVVAVVRKDKDSLYGKIIKKTTKYLVHDELNISNQGDIVEIVYLRPLSAKKSWGITKILQKA